MDIPWIVPAADELRFDPRGNLAVHRWPNGYMKHNFDAIENCGKTECLKKLLFLVCMFLMTGCGSKEVDYWTSEVFGYILSMPSGDDHDECMAISKEVKSKYNFTVMSKIFPGMPAFGGSPGCKGLLGVTPHDFAAFEITDPVEQDKIVDIMREYKKSHKTYPVIIKFYKEQPRDVSKGIGKTKPLRIIKIYRNYILD